MKMKIDLRWVVTTLLAVSAVPLFAEKVAAYLLPASSGSASNWVVTNNYTQRVDFVMVTQDGDRDGGMISPGVSYGTHINAGKYYHIFACVYPGSPLDSKTGSSPTFDTQGWDCSS